MLRIFAVSVGHREPLTRRARHDSIEPPSDAGKLTDIAPGDQIRTVYHAETVPRECTVQQANAWKE
jgi:hypothetical protein